MKNIVKKFVETYTMDCEGRNGEWKATAKTYEEAVKGLNAWVAAVREVEKTFNPETFEITVKVIKKTENEYDWDKREYKAVETIY